MLRRRGYELRIAAVREGICADKAAGLVEQTIHPAPARAAAPGNRLLLTREALESELARHNGNKAATARTLGISAENKEAVWKEIFRVLKPGGRFVVSDIYSLEPVPDMYRNDPDAVAECWTGAVTKEVYLATLRETGFATVQGKERCAAEMTENDRICPLCFKNRHTDDHKSLQHFLMV